MGRLDGKIALVTGTARGMGRSAALLFAAEGARVAGCDMLVDEAEETVELVRAAGGEMTSTAPVDLSTEEGARRWVEVAVGAYGGIDVLSNNASSPRVGPSVDLTPEDWHYTIRNELDIVHFVSAAAWQFLFHGPDAPSAKLAEANRLGRTGYPEDVAKLAAFLASDDAWYVNAAAIPVDGGQATIESGRRATA